jgi:hypothetical protein
LVIAPLSTVFDADLFQRFGEAGHIGRVVELAAITRPLRPGEDRGDRVGRGRLALLVLAIVAGDGAVRGFGLDGLAIGRHQHRGHQAERAEALRHLIRLHVAIVILAGPDELAAPLQRGGDHVVDQAVFVDDTGGGELVGLNSVSNTSCEQILEAAVIGLEDGVLGRQIDRPAEVEAIVHRGAGEIADRIVEVVHRHGATPELGS